MAIESRVIQSTVDIETIETISDMAEKERRSFSSMVALLLEEAVTAREQSHKTEKQHA